MGGLYTRSTGARQGVFGAILGQSAFYYGLANGSPGYGGLAGLFSRNIAKHDFQ